jgi:hypothetical protein
MALIRLVETTPGMATINMTRRAAPVSPGCSPEASGPAPVWIGSVNAVPPPAPLDKTAQPGKIASADRTDEPESLGSRR